jgi:hypothetical protein
MCHNYIQKKDFIPHDLPSRTEARLIVDSFEKLHAEREGSAPRVTGARTPFFFGTVHHLNIVIVSVA